MLGPDSYREQLSICSEIKKMALVLTKAITKKLKFYSIS
jgi:hypothetical protein